MKPQTKQTSVCLQVARRTVKVILSIYQQFYQTQRPLDYLWSQTSADFRYQRIMGGV